MLGGFSSIIVLAMGSMTNLLWQTSEGKGIRLVPMICRYFVTFWFIDFVEVEQRLKVIELPEEQVAYRGNTEILWFGLMLQGWY